LKNRRFVSLISIFIIISMITLTFPVAAIFPNSTKKIVASKVMNVNGNPAFVVDYGDKSEVMDDIPYVTYSYTKDNVKYMADNGSKTFEFVVTFADSADLWTKPVWLGQDKLGNNIFDYSLLDERINMTLSVCPDAKILIRLYLGVPGSWLKDIANEDARAVTMKADGTKSFYYANNGITADNRYYYSISSGKVKQEMGRALKESVTRLESKYGGNILGYTLTGLATEEWYRHGWHSSTFDDYSPAAELEFKNFLRSKYKTDSSLRAAWNKGSSFTFDSVSIPAASRRVANTSGGNFLNTTTDMDLIDFYRFYNESVPDFINAVAGYVKLASPNKIVGCIYGYQYEFGSDPASGENALGKLSRAENIDFVKFEAGASFRLSGKGGDNFRGPATSVMMNGKVTMIDNDTATSMFKQTDAFKNADPTLVAQYEKTMPATNGLTSTPYLSGNVEKRIIGFAGSNGFIPTFFDLHGGYYNEVEIRTAMAEAEKIYKASMTYDRTSASQILLVTDEASCDYIKTDYIYDGNTAMAEDTRRVINNLMKSGMPYDSIVVDDLDKANLDQYKIIYFMCSYNATDAQRALIENAKGGNRTIVWAYAPGIFNNSLRNDSYMKSLTGLDISTTSFGLNQVSISNITDFGQILSRITGTNNTSMSTNRSTERFKVNDPNATVIGTNGSFSNMAYRKFSNWTSMYVPFAGLSVDIFRALGEFSGVHIYSDRNGVSDETLRYDTISAGKNLIFVHANGDRTRVIKFPTSSDVYDPLTNQKLASNVSSISLTMTNGTTKALRIQSPGSVAMSIGEPIPEITDPSTPSRTKNGYLVAVKNKTVSYGNWGKVEYKFVNLEVSKTYKVSYWAKIPEPESGQTVSSALGWYNGGIGDKQYASPPLLNGNHAVIDDQWHYYTSTVTIPAKDLTQTNPKPGTSPYYSLLIYSSTNNGSNPSWSDLYLDDVQIVEVDPINSTPVSGVINLISGGDFESTVPSSGWLGDFTNLSINDFVPVQLTNIHSGNKSLRVNRKSPRANYTGLSLVGGTTYTLTYFVKTEASASVGVTLATIVQGAYPIQIVDKSSAILIGGYASYTALDANWCQYTTIFTPTISSNIFAFGIDSRPQNSDFYIDDVVLTAAGSTTNLIVDSGFENATQSNFNGDGNGWPTANWIDNKWYSEYAYQVHEYGNPSGPKALYIESYTPATKLNITFYSQGGSAASSITSDYNATIPEPNHPTKTGYTFGGWYKDTSYSVLWDFTNNKVLTDTILYAKWTINKYTVTFKLDGGSLNGGGALTQTIVYGKPALAPSTPTKNGMLFSKWDKVFGNITGDLVITAIYTSVIPQNITSNTLSIDKDKGVISKIFANTSVSNLKAQINENQYLKIFKGDIEVTGDYIVGTGMKVKLMDGSNVIQTLTIVIIGDATGDGSINVGDLLKLKQYLLKQITPTNEEKLAADVTGDGNFNVGDLLKLKQYLLKQVKL
jgi:uncharacterized repeat protein (TIGR02543 family)